MNWLLRRVPNCEMVPRGYGFVYVDYIRMEAIYSPVPLNLLFAFVRASWLWMAHDFYTRDMAIREKGFAVGFAPEWAPRFRMGVRLRWGSLWIGAHWSRFNRRLCINLVPCVTVWIVLPGGITP